MHEIWEALVEGAPFSFINLGVLAFGVGVIIDRAWYIRMNYSVDAAEFMNRIRKLVQAGNIDRAIRQCEAKAVPLLEVVKSGLTQVNRGEEAVIASMEEKMSEVLEQGVGLKIFAIGPAESRFPGIRVSDCGPDTPYLEIAAGWNLLVEIGLRMGIDLDNPVRARKVGNEFRS